MAKSFSDNSRNSKFVEILTIVLAVVKHLDLPLNLSLAIF